MNDLLSKWKWLILAMVVLLGIVCIVVITGSGLVVSRLNRETTPTVEPVTFEYCGERFTELCIVSFGRDVFGNTIVNLYVPDKKYPPFHLIIVRLSGESRFECEVNDKLKTSVYCVGQALNLGEGLEIQLRADMDDQLLAKGTFSLKAFLMTTPISNLPTLEPDMGFKVLLTDTPASSSEPTTPTVPPSVTARPGSGNGSATPTSTPASTTATPTSSSSYPNYP